MAFHRSETTTLEALLSREAAGMVGTGESLSKLSLRFDVFTRPRPITVLVPSSNMTVACRLAATTLRTLMVSIIVVPYNCRKMLEDMAAGRP